jgi:hypothetical protein
MVAKKKVVKKKPTTLRVKELAVNRTPPVMRFKTVAGDDIVAFVEAVGDNIVAIHPMIVSIYDQMVIMSPYGLSAKDEVFLFSPTHIVNIHEVDEQFKILYVVAREALGASTKEYYDQMVFNGIQAYRRQIARRNEVLIEPTKEQLEAIEKEPKPKTVSITASVNERTRSDVVDSLVELAEKAGKGKNKVVNK